MVSGLLNLTSALFRLAFASAPCLPLNLAKFSNSPVHSSIGTPSHLYRAPTACKHKVSGSFSLRSRGSFHLSLSVLSLSVVLEYLALDGGPPDFSPDSSCPAILWSSLASFPFRLRDFHTLWFAFPNNLTKEISTFCESLTPSTRRLTV